jgi:hypothetical protein
MRNREIQGQEEKDKKRLREKDKKRTREKNSKDK